MSLYQHLWFNTQITVYINTFTVPLNKSGRQPLSGVYCCYVRFLLFTCFQICICPYWENLPCNNKPPNYGFRWVLLLMRYFIILETICGSRVTGTYPYPLHALYAWARIFLTEQSRGMRSSEGKGRRGKHWKSCERFVKITKKSQSRFIAVTGGWDVDLCHVSLQDTNTHLPEVCLSFQQVQVGFVKNTTACKLCLLPILTPLLPERKLEQ